MRYSNNFNGLYYEPVSPPKADSGDLARGCSRLMFRHSNVHRSEATELFIAPPDVMYAGWVIGLFPPEITDAFKSEFRFVDWQKDVAAGTTSIGYADWLIDWKNTEIHARSKGEADGASDAARFNDDSSTFIPTANPFGLDTDTRRHEWWEAGYENVFEANKQ